MKEKLKIAIQGKLGAFHHVAAKKYFNKSTFSCVQCTNFTEITVLTSKSEVDFGVLAIENTVVGSILPNYELVRKANLHISGEVYLRIEQNLLVKKGTTISEITEVHSHPMALLQCSDYFLNHPNIALTKSSDTATSAFQVSKNKFNNVAAIASKLAAKKYNLKILSEGIENNKLNFTRFFILSHQKTVDTKNISKSSLCFELSHKSGSLAGVLSIVSLYGINLSKIQSHPIVGKPWQYLFYIDLVFKNYKRYQELLTAIRPITLNLNILGEYKKGILPSEEEK